MLAAMVGFLCCCKPQPVVCEGTTLTRRTLGREHLPHPSRLAAQMPGGGWKNCFNKILGGGTSRTRPTPAIGAKAEIQKRSSGLPGDVPSWIPGTGFGAGTLNAGEFSLVRITAFQQVWNSGTASYYNPVNVPDGYHSLGSYGEVNSVAFSGWVLAIAGSFDREYPALRRPTDYSLVWTNADLPKIEQNGLAYFWAPVVPSGYKALGFVVTNSPDVPEPEDIVLVREDLTDSVKTDSLLWNTSDLPGVPGLSTWTTKPAVVGISGLGIPVNTFYCNAAVTAEDSLSVACLKNVNRVLDLMPTFDQLVEILGAYGPTVYFHPQEIYLPATPQWFFDRGALLYAKSNPDLPVRVERGGANLPPGGSNDGEYWLDLPNDGTRETVKKGDLSIAKVQVHVKPMLGGIVTDLSCWIYYCFNGSSTAKLGIVPSLPLGKIGEHVGDWEHFVIRVDNFSGELHRIYLAAHSGGTWVRPHELEFNNGNKAVVYSSKNGHALYRNTGEHLQGGSKIGVGIRNDTAKSTLLLDTSVNYEVINVDYLSEKGETGYPAQPPWVEFLRQWGPSITYDSKTELERIISFLPALVRKSVLDLLSKLPVELGGEEGPTGPKEKDSWTKDER